MVKKKWTTAEKVVYFITVQFAVAFCISLSIFDVNESSIVQTCITSIIISFIVPIIFVIYLINKRVPKIDANKIRWKLEDSNPYEFEELVADMFKRLGYQSVKTTPKSVDVGADITMKRKGIKYVVQVKKYAEDNKIGRPDLQRLQGSAQHFHAMGMIFVTYGFYSRHALDYAKQHGIETIDNNELINLMNKQYRKER